MEMNWKFFIGAAFLVFMALLKYNAPIPALAAGVGLAALWNWSRHRKAASVVRQKPLSRK
jgi:hypothetical protein